jgi:hypothetical protein
MAKRNLILFADLILDFVVIFGFIYLLSQGYFEDLDGQALNRLFLWAGAVGLILASITIYLLIKK